MKWSFSTERCFRRCQRQYYFREIAAWHNGRDPLRRQAFLLKQAKGLDLWRGILVHKTIEREVVPRLLENTPVPWDDVIDSAHTLARLQFDFSVRGKYRDPGITKSNAGDAYRVLLPHIRSEDVSEEALGRVFVEIEQALRNLAGMHSLWTRISGRGRYWSEVLLSVNYAGARLEAQIDLLSFRGYGKPTIVEWKTYASDGGGDARLQAAVYGWALCRSTKWAVRNPSDVELLEAQLLSGELLEHRFSENDFNELEDRIYRSVLEMRALVGEGPYGAQVLEDFAFARSPWTCVYCPFRPLCLQTESTGVEHREDVVALQMSLFYQDGSYEDARIQSVSDRESTGSRGKVSSG